VRTSTDRILTTHVGSLPRSEELAEVLFRKDKGEFSEAGAGIIKDSVAQVVQAQVDAGIDIPNDGEQGKVGYSTYMMDRLNGFGGDTERKIALDLVGHPELRVKLAHIMGKQRFRRASCIGPISVRDWTPLQIDIANLGAAVDAGGAGEAFMNSASPGLVTAFQPNQYYDTHEEYLQAIAEVMREEYKQIIDAGFILQLDCPDLAMARHTGFQDLSETEFLKRAELHIEAMNHALEDIPAARSRIHVCWGNYEGPHDFDIPLERIIDIVLKAKPAGILFEASNARHEHEWQVWADANIHEDKILIPGAIDTCTNLVEHPELVAQRIERFAGIVGKERVIAGTDCGFGTFAGYGRVDSKIAYKKLRSLVEGSAIASDRLWS
jgi:5-methyltetrahydropteroyltriglutamate--homocysteine methyltransferase